MELRFKIFCAIALLFFQVPVKASVDALIIQQKNADNNTYHEQKIDKKDVYSNAKLKAFELDDLPAEKNCFVIKELILDNNFLRKKLENTIKKSVVGRCVGPTGINKMATALQDYYIDAGYITTRVDIPSQNISSGELKLTVDAGRIDKIIIEGNDILPWILPFKKGDILNIRNIEQGLENLQQVPGVNVKIDIEPGSRNGYSNVLINTHRFKKWSVKAIYDNWGDEATGRYRASVIGYLFNALKSSDLFYLAGTKSTTGQYENISTYYSLPVNYWNYYFYYSKSKSKQNIPLAWTAMDYVGDSEYWSAKAARTLYRDSSRKLTGSAEFIRRNYNYTIAGEELALQKRNMGNVKFGINYKQQLADGNLSATLSWQRFLTWFGGEKTPDMVYGNVSSASQLFNLEGNYTKQFSNSIYSMNFFSQYTPDELTLQDQLTIGDRWSVRGFENSVGLTGNNGFFVQNTLYRPLGFLPANYYIGVDLGQIKEDIYYGDEFIVGGAIGLQGNFKSLEYDVSVSAPFKYPGDLNVDKANINFNFSYQI